MSSRKVKPLVRVLPVLSSSFASGETTFVTATHYLTTGDLVTIRFKNFPQSLTDIAVTVLSGTSFKVATPNDFMIVEDGEVQINFFGAGQTGRQRAITLNHSSGAPAVLQSYVKGTGGAVYTIEGSLDNSHWTTDSPITHAGVTDDTQASTIVPAWAWVTINLTSIGASTKLYVNISS